MKDETMTVIRSITRKLMSGRWLFTVSAAATFTIMSVRGQLPADDVKELLMLIATFYFIQRTVEKTNGNSDGHGA